MTWINTFPSKKDTHWQFDILPNIWILRNKDGEKQIYYVIGFTWLFWGVALTI